MASLNRPVRSDTIISGGYEVYIRSVTARESWSRVGVFRDGEITFGGTTSEDIYTNWYTKKIVGGDQINFAFSLHEQRPEIIEVINGGGSIRTVSDGVTPFAGELYELQVDEWSLDEYVAIPLANGDGTPVTINTVTGTTDGALTFGTLTPGTDYDLTQDALTKATLVRFKTGGAITTENQTLTIDYDVTPAKGDFFTEQSSYTPVPFECLVRWVGIKSSDGSKMYYNVLLENVTNDKNYPGLIGDRDESTVGLPCAFS